MSFVAEVRARAAASRKRVAFAESADTRTLLAVRALAKAGIVEPVLILDPLRPEAHEAARDTGVETLDPSSSPIGVEIVKNLLARRSSRGLTPEATADLAREPLHFAAGLVAIGRVDASVAGAAHPTPDVLRAALWAVGAAPGVATVSSAFYMVVPEFRDGGEEVLTFADCAVVLEPDAEQLADIAVAAAADRRRIVGDTPIVAFISYSTHGSGAGPSVDRVRDAVRRLREREVDFAVDGELQADAALIADVAERKAPGSGVAGAANVLIFPSLDAGNAAYKLVERLARARAIGPIIQGLARPCADLSRGASTDDIMNVAAIAALQATA